ncbi:MAG: AAA family ATPase [Pirellulaceae bacterium]|nr:AAA family ATPase [Pirellulaceae bacterium]
MSCQTNWAPLIAGQAGVVPLSLGIPGVAKTAFFESLAVATGRRFIAYMLDQSLPEDLKGYPLVQDVEIDGEQARAMVHVLEETRLRAEIEPCVVLLDELTCAGHSVQAAALQWVNNPSRRSWMFAAANPPDKAAAGVDLTPPMVNRLCVVPWETPVEAIREGWRRGLDFPQPDVPILPDCWREHLPKWGIVMDEFIQRFPDLLEAYPRDPAKASEPYPTPRSWTNVIRLLAAAESVGANKSVRRLLMHGCVGEGAGVEFLTFLDTAALPDPEEILADPRSLRLPRRGDLAVAVVRSVLARVESDNSPQRWERCCDVFEHTFRQSREVAMAAYGRLWKLKPSGYLPAQRNGVMAEMDALRSA